MIKHIDTGYDFELRRHDRLTAFVGVLWAEAVDGPQSTILAIGAPGRNSSA